MVHCLFLDVNVQPISELHLFRYVTWLQVLAMCLARLFPQPEAWMLRRNMPAKFRQRFGARLVGIIDCTECRTQTPSEKLAQRALWSEYKSHNTVKYLVVMSPSGATIYVSPAFPGRISDPQICFCCATYSEEDPSAIADLIEIISDDLEE